MWRILLLLIPLPCFADSLVATRTIRAHTTLVAEDVTAVEMDIDGAVRTVSAAIGQETRIAIYAGKPIRSADLGPRAVVERNQVVPLGYMAGGLNIMTEGRALARGGVGDTIEIMNLTSRSKVLGQIGSDGVVRVIPAS